MTRLAASLLDIRLIWRTGPSRRLCLADATGFELQCRTGDHGVSLSGLHLPPGPFTLEVDGDPSATATYLLRIDATTAPAVDFESEPNDAPQTASVIAGLTVRGQFAADDQDTFRVTTTGEPQLWQVDVTGTGISGLLWENPDTTELGYGDVTPDRTSAHMTDVYLIPGDHWLRVDGSDGDYSLVLTPLGPPDPNGEREPNNRSINAEPLVVGSVRTGRLPSPQDADVFRLTVDTPDHLRVTVTPPADGSINLRLESGSLRVGRDPGRTGDAHRPRRAAPAWRLRPVAPAGDAQPRQVLAHRGARGPIPAGRRPGARQRAEPGTAIAAVAARRRRLPRERGPGLVRAGQPPEWRRSRRCGRPARTCGCVSRTA